MASIETRPSKLPGTAPTYRVVWRDGGKKRYQTVATLEAAQLWKATLERAGHDTERAEEALLAQARNTPTLAEVAAVHLDRLTGVQPYTIKRYKGYLKTHLTELAFRPVDVITEAHLAEWIRQMQAKGSSVKTIMNVHGFLSAVMSTAVRRGAIETNPCSERMLPRNDHTRETATYLTTTEYSKVEQHLPAEDRVLFRFMFETGTRLGEATALRPEDFTLDGPVPACRIDKAWKQDGDGGWLIGPPKTKRSRRTVALAASTVTLLRPLLSTTPAGRYVFPSASGATSNPGHRQQLRVWSKAVTAASAEDDWPSWKKPRIHDLRHSHAALMLAAGMNIYELSARLGHESIKTTVDTYGHLVPGAHARAAETAQSVFG